MLNKIPVCDLACKPLEGFGAVKINVEMMPRQLRAMDCYPDTEVYLPALEEAERGHGRG